MVIFKTDGTVCPISSDPFYIVSYYEKWVTTPWTYSTIFLFAYLSINFLYRIHCYKRINGSQKITYSVSKEYADRGEVLLPRNLMDRFSDASVEGPVNALGYTCI